MRFTPPTVIDIIIMISGTRNSHFEEIRVLAHSRRTHKSTSRMSMNTNLIYIYKMMTLRQLLDSIFMIGQRIITHISISIIMIPFRAARVPATLSYRNNNKSGLCQTVGTGTHTGKRIINTFHLWPRINIIHNRINLSWVKIKRFIHHTIQICHTISRLYFKYFRKFITGSKKLWKITLLNIHYFIAISIQQDGARHCIYTRIIIHHKTSIIIHFHTMEIIPFGQ